MRSRLDLSTSGTVDLYDDIPYSLNYAIADIREPDKRNSSFSKTITVPGSKNNNDTFAHIFEVNIDCNFNPNKKTPCTLYVDEMPVMVGYLQLLKVNKLLEGKIEYELAIRGNVGNIFQSWGDRYLTDLDFSAFDHTYNKTNQEASWSATVGSGYVYPMIDYGVTNGLTFDVNNFYPAMYVKQYIDTMFSFAGYTYSSNFFNTDFFKRLIIPYNQTNLLLSGSEIGHRTTTGQVSATYTAKTMVSSAASAYIAYTTNTPEKIHINSSISDYYSQLNTSTYIATLANTGSYQFGGNVSFYLSFSGMTSSPYLLPFDFNIYFYLGIWDNSGTLVQTLGLAYQIVPSQIVTNGADTTTYQVIFNSQTLQLYAGQKIGLGYSLDGIYLGQAGTIDLKIVSGSQFSVTAINTGIYDGDSVHFGNMAVPQNIKIKDFFTSLIKMFNLYIEVDKTVTNKLYIEPRNDFYANGTTLDWTDKLALDRPLNITPMGDLQASRYKFKYKEDKDYYNQQYINAYQEPYGTRNYDVETDFIKQEKVIDVIFAPTPMARIGTTDRVIPEIISINDSGTTVDVKNCNIRILYYGGLKTTNNSWTYTSTASGTTTRTNYPYCGHIDEPSLPTFDLNFGVPYNIYWTTGYYTNNNLFNQYWKKQIEEITDRNSKIVTCYLYLTPKDIFALDFRNQFYINGMLLRLNKVIDYNPLANDLTQCEFINIKEALTFTPHTGVSILGWPDYYTSGEFTPHVIDGIVTHNWGDGVLGGGGAGGNVIDPTVTNGVVLGVGNYVGFGVNNVNIFGSSGVTVNPNLTNVNVINTNNVIVTQSNTTWINGINYSSSGQSEQNITAHAGGGQLNAYQTTKKFNLIETCATTGDSVKTITAIVDAEQQFKNVGAATVYIYPKEGEQFRKGTTLMGANVPYQIASRNSLHIYCYETGIWTD